MIHASATLRERQWVRVDIRDELSYIGLATITHSGSLIWAKNNVELNKRPPEGRPLSLDFGGWYKVRTCDPCRVKAVLYH